MTGVPDSSLKMTGHTRSFFSGRTPNSANAVSTSPSSIQKTDVTKLITQRTSVPTIGTISISSTIRATADRNQPRRDSRVTRIAFTTVVTTSHATQTIVVRT